MGIRQPLPLAISSAVMSVSSSATLFFLVEQQCDLNPQGRFSFCQSDAGMWRYENQVEFPFVFQIFLWGQSYTSLLGEMRKCVEEVTQVFGEVTQVVGEMMQFCWGNEANCWGSEENLLGK